MLSRETVAQVVHLACTLVARMCAYSICLSFHLVDMVGAELDTNNTGLFKLTMHLRRTTSSAVSTHRTNSADSCNSLVRNLTAHMVSAEDTDGTLRSELRGADQVVRPVSLVLKAIQTLQLVEWLTALMDLRM